MNRLLVTTPPGSPQCLGLLLRENESGPSAGCSASPTQSATASLPSAGIPAALMELSLLLQHLPGQGREEPCAVSLYPSLTHPIKVALKAMRRDVPTTASGILIKSARKAFPV